MPSETRTELFVSPQRTRRVVDGVFRDVVRNEENGSVFIGHKS